MIYLMRHGQDDESYIGGWSDVSLTKEGIGQVTETALWIRDNLNISKIICSNVFRTRQTAKIVSDIIGIDYSFDINLREQNKGLLNGMLKEKAEVEYKDFFESEITVDTVYPTGESLKDLYNRIKIYLDTIMKMDDNTLLVTHRGVINMIYYLLNNQELDMNKSQFEVVTASIHELDTKNKMIRKVR